MNSRMPPNEKERCTWNDDVSVIWVIMLEKNFSRPKEYLTKALELDPYHKQTLVNLGTVYQEKFDFDKSQKYWKS